MSLHGEALSHRPSIAQNSHFSCGCVPNSYLTHTVKTKKRVGALRPNPFSHACSIDLNGRAGLLANVLEELFVFIYGAGGPDHSQDHNTSNQNRIEHQHHRNGQGKSQS
jgi:hypothetical protein